MRSAVPWNGGAQKRDLGGTQTRDTQNRNRSSKSSATLVFIGICGVCQKPQCDGFAAVWAKFYLFQVAFVINSIIGYY